jgi:hypothetical protein
MFQPNDTVDDELEVLSRLARQAAERGQWDQVAFHYSRRGALLSRAPVEPELARRLLEHDRAIEARLSVVHRAWHEQLAQIMRMNRRGSALAAGAGDSIPQGRFKDVLG